MLLLLSPRPRPRPRQAARLLPAVLLVASVSWSADARAADDWLGKDKALHFGFSAAIAGGAYGASALVVRPYWARLGIGAGVALAAGAGKELYDMTGRGDPSWKDFTWDVVGTFVGLAVSLAVDVAIRGPHPEASTSRPAARSASAFRLAW